MAEFDIKTLLEKRGGEAMGLLDRYVNPAFAKVLRTIGYDVDFVRGQGAYLWDSEGHQYLDCLSGYGTFGCGRGHPTIRKAVQDAMDMDLPNLLKMGVPRVSGLLAEKLCEIAPEGLEKVFFTNSGSEAVETALKFAKAATGRERIVYCEKGFHGLTTGSLALNGGNEFREGFGRLLEPTTRIKFNDLDMLEHELRQGDVACFVVEPIQGKGVRIAEDGYLQGVSELCEKYGTLFVADEVQSGMGRTGEWFAVDHWGVKPDILTVAKTLSGGYVPVGAVLCKNWIHKKVFSSMDRCVVHSTTYGQNDLAMVAGLAAIAVIEQEGLIDNARKQGDALVQRLGDMVQKYDLLKAVRGKGLMIGVEFGAPRGLKLKVGWKMIHAVDGGLFPQAILMPLLSEYRILAQVAGHNMDVIKLLPTFVINEGDVDWLVKAFDETIGACHQFGGPIWQVAKKLGAQVVKRK